MLFSFFLFRSKWKEIINNTKNPSCFMFGSWSKKLSYTDYCYPTGSNEILPIQYLHHKRVQSSEKRAQSSKKAQLLAEERVAEVEGRLEGVELKLVEAASLNLAQADQIVDLKSAFEACENKWYDEGFADAEKSVEPVVHQARLHGFGEGWLAAFQVMGVLEDSPLRDPG